MGFAHENKREHKKVLPKAIMSQFSFTTLHCKHTRDMTGMATLREMLYMPISSSYNKYILLVKGDCAMSCFAYFIKGDL